MLLESFFCGQDFVARLAKIRFRTVRYFVQIQISLKLKLLTANVATKHTVRMRNLHVATYRETGFLQFTTNLASPGSKHSFRRGFIFLLGTVSNPQVHPQAVEVRHRFTTLGTYDGL